MTVNIDKEYDAGSPDVETDYPKGLNADIVKTISAKKEEPVATRLAFKCIGKTTNHGTTNGRC